MYEWLSDRALERRYAKILAMRAADHNRFKLSGAEVPMPK